MNYERVIPAEDMIHMQQDREKAIQLQENKYWEIFGPFIPVVQKLYSEGCIGSCITLPQVDAYTKSQHLLYWKRIFGPMIYTVQKDKMKYNLHIVFHLE